MGTIPSGLASCTHWSFVRSHTLRWCVCMYVYMGWDVTRSIIRSVAAKERDPPAHPPPLHSRYHPSENQSKQASKQAVATRTLPSPSHPRSHPPTILPTHCTHPLHSPHPPVLVPRDQLRLVRVQHHRVHRHHLPWLVWHLVVVRCRPCPCWWRRRCCRSAIVVWWIVFCCDIVSCQWSVDGYTHERGATNIHPPARRPLCLSCLSVYLPVPSLPVRGGGARCRWWWL
jgi:hypothetical protein